MSTRSRPLIVVCELGMIGAECLWGLRRKMRRVLADCRTWIVGGGNRNLMGAGPGYQMLFGYEDCELDIVLAAAGMVVLDRHMKMVAARFELGTAALGCESLWL